MRIILASNSPRRKELLLQIGLEFEIIPSSFEETEQVMDPADLVRHFAFMKARDVAERTEGEALVVGSDTIVYCDRIMGKPKNARDAYDMLRCLSGREHFVLSGIAVFNTLSGEYRTAVEKTKVRIKTLTDQEINGYINTGEPMDKAGAYAIQGLGALFVEGIEGCYFNVVGLPIFKLSNILKEFGVEVLK